MIIYIENLKITTKKLLELISEFSLIAEYKVDIPKSVISLCSNSQLLET